MDYDIIKEFNITNDSIINFLPNTTSLKLLSNGDNIRSIIEYSSRSQLDFLYQNSGNARDGWSDYILNLIDNKVSFAFRYCYYFNLEHLIEVRYNEHGELYFNVMYADTVVSLNDYEENQFKIYEIMEKV